MVAASLWRHSDLKVDTTPCLRDFSLGHNSVSGQHSSSAHKHTKDRVKYHKAGLFTGRIRRLHFTVASHAAMLRRAWSLWHKV